MKEDEAVIMAEWDTHTEDKPKRLSKKKSDTRSLPSEIFWKYIKASPECVRQTKITFTDGEGKAGPSPMEKRQQHRDRMLLQHIIQWIIESDRLLKFLRPSGLGPLTNLEIIPSMQAVKISYLREGFEQLLDPLYTSGFASRHPHTTEALVASMQFVFEECYGNLICQEEITAFINGKVQHGMAMSEVG